MSKSFDSYFEVAGDPIAEHAQAQRSQSLWNGRVSADKAYSESERSHGDIGSIFTVQPGDTVLEMATGNTHLVSDVDLTHGRLALHGDGNPVGWCSDELTGWRDVQGFQVVARRAAE